MVRAVGDLGSSARQETITLHVMARERKTVDVVSLKEQFNLHIRKATTPEARRALGTMCSDMLMEANRYRGFGYCDAGGRMVTYEEGVTDRSMVQYY